MAVSMTGYGKGIYENGDISIKAEVKSVNSRYLDINFKSSRGLSFAEEKIRGIVKDSATRGKIDIYVGVQGSIGDSKKVVVDEKLAQSYKEALTGLKKKFGFKKSLTVDALSALPGIISLEETEPEENEIMPFVEEAVQKALDTFVAMRENEGGAIEEDMKEKITEMKKAMALVEKSCVGIVDQYKEKLNLRIKELTEGNEPDETRLCQEVAFYADKSCVDEEITRINSHIRQFEETLGGRTIGRKLDFIIQEMNREANTIGSKSSNIELTNQVLELKSIIEKLREQAQNIE